ncbi:MAG: glycosyltransferase [Candidatus Zambryskibacteria bacterium]|nr:glycosyltransferase [Candidatus Zambryskibacteria bacterium]
MKVLYVSAIDSNAFWGAEWFMNKAFLENKVDTITIDYRKNKYNLASKFLKINGDFDFLFLQRGEEFPLELLGSVKKPKFFWASELVSRRRDQDRLFQSGLFNHVFVRSVDCIERIVNNGWLTRDKVSILLSSFDPNTYKKIAGIEKDIDVLFVGSLTKRRKIILDKLKRKFNITIASAYASEANILYNRAKIVLNIHSEDFLDTETRVFEVLGSGSLLITEKLSGENPFINGTHLAETTDIDDMIAKINHFLSNQREGAVVAESGRMEVLRTHTFNHRAKEIINVFNTHKNSEKFPLSSMDINRVKKYLYKERVLYLFYKIYTPFFRIKRKIIKIFNL